MALSLIMIGKSLTCMQGITNMKSVKKMTITIVIGVTFLIALHAPTTYSQDDNEDETCNDLVAQALQTVGSACAEIGQNEACYGYNAIDSVFVDEADVDFVVSGDIADLSDLISLETQSADPDEGIWGIAFISIQADLPDESEDSLTFVLLGGTSLSEDEGFDDNSTQAFTIQSGESETCAEAPDGLLIRSPEGQRARVVVNGVELTMSSTLFITAHEDGEMTLQGIDGEIEVTVDGETETLTAGMMTNIPLDGLRADGPPTRPELVDAELEFPPNIVTSLLPSIDSASADGNNTSTFPNIYSDETIAFSYPDGWAVQVVPATEFLSTYIALSNNPSYMEAAINDPSSVGNTAPDTVYALIYTLPNFGQGQYSSAEAAVQGTVEATAEFHNIIEGSTSITLDPHAATRAQIGFTFQQDTWDGPIYGVGNYVVAIRVMPGSYGEFQDVIEEILGTISSE